MSASLVLKLDAPLQSWGHQGRHDYRTTGATPTKSGVVGLIAAAQGRPRTAPVDDLASLRFAVRVDQPGVVLRDYQTAQPWQRNPKGSASLVTRYFLQDAVFCVALEASDRAVLEECERALRKPVYPLFLGRRSCPANWDVVHGIVDGGAVEAMRSVPWFAKSWYRKRSSRHVSLPIFRDGMPGESGERRQDVPVSFSQEHRDYGWRTVVEVQPLTLVNEDGQREADPFMEAVMAS